MNTYPKAVVREQESGPEGVARQAALLEVTCREDAEWMTPGSLMAHQLSAIPQVRFVAERLEGARYAVFVVLDDDPEEVLDSVFDAERQTMQRLPGISFDLRVRKPHADWSPDNLLASCFKQYGRQ